MQISDVDSATKILKQLRLTTWCFRFWKNYEFAAIMVFNEYMPHYK